DRPVGAAGRTGQTTTGPGHRARRDGTVRDGGDGGFQPEQPSTGASGGGHPGHLGPNDCGAGRSLRVPAEQATGFGTCSILLPSSSRGFARPWSTSILYSPSPRG